MKKHIVFLIAFILTSCNEVKIINDKGIQSMNIQFLDLNSQSLTYTNQDSILYIVNKLNNCTREPFKFERSHTIILNYEKGREQLIICNGNLMKVDGLTYKTNCFTEDIIRKK